MGVLGVSVGVLGVLPELSGSLLPSPPQAARLSIMMSARIRASVFFMDKSS